MSLRHYADDCRRNSRKDAPVNFIPETYWIDDAKEKAEFINKLVGKVGYEIGVGWVILAKGKPNVTWREEDQIRHRACDHEVTPNIKLPVVQQQRRGKVSTEER